MSKSYPFLFILCVAQLIGLSWGQSCYSPGGRLSSTYFPCYPNAGTSLCCPMGWTCFSSNLCMVTDTSAAGSQFAVGTAQRGGCTNKSGDDDLCGDYCLDSDNDSLVSCGSNRYCCGSKAAQGLCNCKTGEGTFAAEGGTAKTIMGQTGMEKTATEIKSGATSASTASISASTTLSTSTTRTGTSSASNTLETGSGSATDGTAQNTSSSTATASPASVPFTQKTGFKVMMAIFAIAIVAIIIAAIILWRRRKRNAEYEPGLRDDGSSMDLSNIPPPPSHLTRPTPDPYGYPHRTSSPSIGGPTEVRETRFRDIEDPLTPPVLDPYRLPPAMASIPPRPYEGT